MKINTASRFSAVFIVFFALLGLVGCSGYDPQVWHAHKERNENLQEWRIFAVVHSKYPGRGEIPFAISWLQKADVADVYFIPPGRQKARMHILAKSDYAEVFIFEDADRDDAQDIRVKEHYQGNDIDSLLNKIESPFPISGLVYWLRGLPKPTNLNLASGAAVISIGNDNRMNFVGQDYWNVTYLSYGEYEGYQLPKRIKLESSLLKGNEMSIDIKHWQFRDFDKY